MGAHRGQRHELESVQELPREFRGIGQQAKAAGWRMWMDGSNHWQWYAPEPSQVRMSTPGTPGRGRSVQNSLADFRRAWRRWEAELHAGG